VNEINAKRKAMGIDDDSDGNDQADTDQEIRANIFAINVSRNL